MGLGLSLKDLGKQDKQKDLKLDFCGGVGSRVVCTCLTWDLEVDPWLPIPSERFGGSQIFVESRP